MRCSSVFRVVLGLSLAAVLCLVINRNLIENSDVFAPKFNSVSDFTARKTESHTSRRTRHSQASADEDESSAADGNDDGEINIDDGQVSSVVGTANNEDGEYCPKQCEFWKRKYRCKKAQPGEINIILYGHNWEPINKDADKGFIEYCPVKCNMRYRGWCDAEKADAAVINVLWTSKTRPTKKPPGQRWVFHGGFETQYHKSSAKRAKNYIMSLEGKIDWTMGFGPRTDFYNPNFMVMPMNHFSGGGRTYDETALTRNWAQNKTGFMLWIVSNCLMATTRMEFWKELEKHLPQKRNLVLGKCGQTSPCKSRKDMDPCNQKMFAKYKFYFAAENGQCEGWITEKFARGLQQGMIPVVFGPSKTDAERLAPRGSFIHADDFDNNPKKLAAHLLALDKDDKAYNRYFEWRSRGLEVFDTYYMYRKAFCELCQQLHLPREEQRPKINKTLVQWFYRDGPFKHGACGWVDGPAADR